MNFSNLKHILRSCVRRNKIILTNSTFKTNKKTVNLHWWRSNGNAQNIGDYLSVIVVDYLKSINNIDKNYTTKTKHLYAIGSIIDGGYQDATIWGSGLIRGKSKFFWRLFRKLDIRCVRGPKTRDILIKNGYNCPKTYGDPALLLPLIYQPSIKEKKFKYSVVRHWSYPQDKKHLNPMTENWKEFIDTLVQSELVISSSLHGIILAEAYGVPAVLLQEGELDLFKYHDYYASTGREKFPMASTIEEALQITPAPQFDISKLQQDLIKSFPTDLWL